MKFTLPRTGDQNTVTKKLTAEEKAAKKLAKREAKAAEQPTDGGGAIPPAKTDPGATAEMPLDDKTTAAKNHARNLAPIGGHDRSLMARSINDRIKTLEDLAKKNKGEGYEVAAVEQERDAKILRDEHLPRYTDTQAGLPFNPESEARQRVKRTVRENITSVSRSLLGKADDWSPNPEQLEVIRRGTNSLTDILIAVLLRSTSEARTQGRLDREMNPAALVESALSKALAQSDTPN